MLARLIQFSLTQRLLMLLLMLLLVGGGWQALKTTPIDAFPDVSTTQVKIIVKAPGMTPEEVESRITSLIEVEMLGIPRQTMLRSIAKYALTDITVDFAEGTDIYWARQQVAERLAAIWGDLPAGVEGGIAPMTTPLGEMFMFSIEGGDLTLYEKRDLLDWTIRPALRSVPGVADVNSLGGLVTTFEVVPDNGRMAANGIQLSDLQDAIAANNRNDGAGRLDEGEEALLVRSQGAITTLDESRRHRRRRQCAAAGARRRYRRGAPVGTDPLRRGHAQRRRARRSRVWCSGCAAPMPAPWCRACRPSWTRSPSACRRASPSMSSTTAACW